MNRVQDDSEHSNGDKFFFQYFLNTSGFPVILDHSCILTELYWQLTGVKYKHD